MATVKFNEGTKFETSLELENGEGIIFVKPPKNTMMTMVDEGCLMGLLTIITLGIIRIFKPAKFWTNEFVITNKRVVSIPLPPNKKNFSAESYYYNRDFGIIKADAPPEKQSDRMVWSGFTLYTSKNSIYNKPRNFQIRMEMSAKNIFKLAGQTLKEGANDMANMLAQHNAQMQSYHNKLEAESSGAAYYKEITFKAQKLSSSETSVEALRDGILEIINGCLEASKK